MGGMQDLTRELTELAAHAAAIRVVPLSEDELLGFLDRVHTAQQMLHAAVLHAVHEIDRRRIPAAQHAPTPQSWLRGRLRVSSPAAHRLLAQARTLHRTPALDKAAGAGRINAEQLDTITTALTGLPSNLPPAVHTEAGAILTRWADHLDPHALRIAGRRILTHAAPDIADALEENWLKRIERDTHRRRYLTLSPAGIGQVRLHGLLDCESAAVLTAALDPLCKPDPTAATTSTAVCKAHPTASTAEGATTTGDTIGTSNNAGDGTTTRSSDSTTCSTSDTTGSSTTAADTGINAMGSTTIGAGSNGGLTVTSSTRTTVLHTARTPGQRRADALIEICRLALAEGQLPDNGGDRPQITVTIAYDPLRRSLGTGTLDNGEPLSAATARRLACDARILPIILNGDSQILDAGRTRRTATGPLRRALNTRDKGCAFPGCDRPPRWCDAHHIISWTDGGPTDLNNLVLLCGYHHRLIHDDTTPDEAHDTAHPDTPNTPRPGTPNPPRPGPRDDQRVVTQPRAGRGGFGDAVFERGVGGDTANIAQPEAANTPRAGAGATPWADAPNSTRRAVRDSTQTATRDSTPDEPRHNARSGTREEAQNGVRTSSREEARLSTRATTRDSTRDEARNDVPTSSREEARLSTRATTRDSTRDEAEDTRAEDNAQDTAWDNNEPDRRNLGRTHTAAATATGRKDNVWEVRAGTDGRPEFLPPAWIDPRRLPRRNGYHQRV
jgi:hypothetical protein